MVEEYRKLILSGKIYIKYHDEPLVVEKGDVRLFLSNDKVTPIVGDYEDTTFSGYFKGEVYDGKHWQLLDLDEFFDNREYRFPKKQKPIYTGLLCQEILANIHGVEIFRTYRGHFTREEYVQEKRITKANRNRKN